MPRRCPEPTVAKSPLREVKSSGKAVSHLGMQVIRIDNEDALVSPKFPTSTVDVAAVEPRGRGSSHCDGQTDLPSARSMCLTKDDFQISMTPRACQPSRLNWQRVATAPVLPSRLGPDRKSTRLNSSHLGI